MAQTRFSIFVAQEPQTLGSRSALRLLERVPRAALAARPLELDMRCGLHGGDSILVTRPDQGARASVRADKLSLPAAPPLVPQFEENELSRNSRLQARPSAARPRRLADEALAEHRRGETLPLDNRL
jgi:hypothetical protein